MSSILESVNSNNKYENEMSEGELETNDKVNGIPKQMNDEMHKIDSEN